MGRIVIPGSCWSLCHLEGIGALGRQAEDEGYHHLSRLIGGPGDDEEVGFIAQIPELHSRGDCVAAWKIRSSKAGPSPSEGLLERGGWLAVPDHGERRQTSSKGTWGSPSSEGSPVDGHQILAARSRRRSWWWREVHPPGQHFRAPCRPVKMSDAYSSISCRGAFCCPFLSLLSLFSGFMWLPVGGGLGLEVFFQCDWLTKFGVRTTRNNPMSRTMEVQAQEPAWVEPLDSGADVLQWILQIWVCSLVLAFLAGIQCWRQCCSRLRQMKLECGERAQMMDWGPGDQEEIEPLSFSSPSPSRVRARTSPSMSSSRQSQSSSKRSSRSSKQKKLSNKQPRGQAPLDTPARIRGRVSVAERGRIVLEAMGSGAKTPLLSPLARNSPWKTSSCWLETQSGSREQRGD